MNYTLLKMIRNYQRNGGGGVDLVPIYNSIIELQNGLNSLLTVTRITTITSESAIVNSLSQSVISLSSSVMDINSVISTLTGGSGGGGGITLTNPTQSAHVFTDPVLYTEPNGNALNNTYMNGVTWKDYPSTATADFSNCVVYGVLSYDNVRAYNLSSCTAQTVVINGCNSGAINGASFGGILLSKCNGAIVSGVNASRLCVPDCSTISIELCHINDVSIDYPSTVTRYNSDYAVTLEGNTIEKINASLLRHSVNNNSIWTANLYVDYSLMQTTAYTPIGFFNSNSINKISIFNNENSLNTKNRGIALNGLSFRENSLGHLWYDLYSPLTIDGNSIETLKNTVGASLSANGNYIQKWNCKVSPYSALVYLFPKNTLAHIQSNTVGKWNLYHGISDDILMTDASLSSRVTAALNSLSINAVNNSASYVTFDVLNPLNGAFTKYISSAHINVANEMTLSAWSIGTLNMAKNDGYVNTTYYVDVNATSARSVGATNICPRFVRALHAVDLLNIHLDDGPVSSTYGLSKMTVNSLNINNNASISAASANFNISSCYIGALNYAQLTSNRLSLRDNVISYCSVTNGSLYATNNEYIRLNINVYSANFLSCEVDALGGTADRINLSSNAITLGGFYYESSSGASNTFDRLNTGITV